MYLPTKLEEGSAWTRQGNTITGKGDTVAIYRGIQADLNFFADKLGFEAIKVDGALGPKTLAALKAVVAAVAKAQPTLAGPAGHDDLADLASHADHTRAWLEETARSALGVGDLRRYHHGTGKEWNVKGDIAYGAGPVHEEFQQLQTDLNAFAGSIGFAPLKVDGFIGKRTADAVKAVYDAVVRKKPMAAMTPFPVPDSKEEAAEFAMFIRNWLGSVATKTLLAEASS